MLSRRRARKRVRRKHHRRKHHKKHHGNSYVHSRFAALARKYHGKIPKGTKL